jgi:hypothetical protein
LRIGKETDKFGMRNEELGIGGQLRIENGELRIGREGNKLGMKNEEIGIGNDGEMMYNNEEVIKKNNSQFSILNSQLYYQPANGSISYEEGHDSTAFCVDMETIQLVKRISEINSSRQLSFKITEKQIKKINNFLIRYFSHHLEKKFMIRDFLGS